MIKKYLLVSSVVLSIVSTANAEPPKMPTPKADVYIVPKVQDIPLDLKYPATIKSYQNVGVYSRVLGVLEKKYFQEGQYIKEGEKLYKIEDNIYKAKKDAKSANVDVAQANYDNANRDWERISRLHSKKAVTDEKRDSALFAYEKAKANLAVAKAELAQAQVDYDHTIVKAPISGVVGLQSVDVGDLVTDNPPKQLVNITQNDKVYLEFSVPYSDYVNVKTNKWTKEDEIKVSVIDNGIVKKDIAKIDFIDVNVDKSTSTIKMRAIADNNDHSLVAGDFVRVSLSGIVQKGMITIPQKALLQNPLGTIVFIEKDGKAEVRPVKVDKESKDLFVVAPGALQSGDKVIVNNFFRVKPNQPVVVDKVINEGK